MLLEGREGSPGEHWEMIQGHKYKRGYIRYILVAQIGPHIL
jgi:hypothetical protein